MTITITEYTAPAGFDPQDDEMGGVAFWDGPGINAPGHGYRIEVSWTPSEGINFFINTAVDQEGMGMDDLEHLEDAIKGLRSQYAAYAVSEDQWLEAQRFELKDSTVEECIAFAEEIGVPSSAVFAIWRQTGRIGSFTGTTAARR